MQHQRVVAAAICLVACVGGRVPGPAWEPTPEGERIAQRWLEQSQGFDALAAYEILGFEQPIRFALARKWSGDGVKVLSYVVEPKDVADAAFLTVRGPGRRSKTLFRNPCTRQVGRPPPPNEATAVAAEVAQPVLPSDFVYRRLPDAYVGEDVCFVVEGRPTPPVRGFTHLALWISQNTGVALRKIYYRGDAEMRRVSVEPEHVREFDGRWLATRQRVRTASGVEAEIVLHRVVSDPYLPDSVFSERALRARRFPHF